MPAPARKAPAKKIAPAKPTPTEAAVAEALGEGDVSMNFRGENFVMKSQNRESWDFMWAAMENNGAEMIFQMVSPEDRLRLRALGKLGESYLEVASEFFGAFEEASGQGKSETS